MANKTFAGFDRDLAGIKGFDSCGNNLFGIKADSRWTGERVTVTTLEYEGGLPKPQRAQFRAYPNLAAGFEDYVRFLKDNPRYDNALRAGGNAGVYADRLQSSGYATDPRYAEKIRSIIEDNLRIFDSDVEFSDEDHIFRQGFVDSLDGAFFVSAGTFH